MKFALAQRMYTHGGNTKIVYSEILPQVERVYLRGKTRNPNQVIVPKVPRIGRKVTNVL